MTTYEYDTIGNLSKIVHPNNTQQLYTYDSLNHLTKLEHQNSSGTALASFVYTLSPIGERTTIEELDRTTTYTYDELSRLLTEEIKIGDKLWAYNEANKTKSLQEVTHLIRGEGSKELVDIKLQSGEIITATSNHPFWAVADQNWTDAGKLTADSILLDINEKNSTISSVRDYTQSTTVYNLTVANDHTYFVGVSGVLGHNACLNTPTIKSHEYDGFEAHWKDDLDAYAHFNQIFRGNQAKGSAGKMLADAFKSANLKQPRSIEMDNIINKETLEGFKNGLDISQTLFSFQSVLGWNAYNRLNKLLYAFPRRSDGNDNNPTTSIYLAPH